MRRVLALEILLLILVVFVILHRGEIVSPFVGVKPLPTADTRALCFPIGLARCP